MGFLAAVIAQLCGSLGLLLMKSSSIYEYGLPWHKKCRLFGGLFFQGVVPIVTDSFAYAVCPLSLLAPLSGITIAATIVFTAARCCGVREPVHCADFAVVVMVVSGVSLVNVYGPHSSKNINMINLAQYMLNPTFVVFGSTMLTISTLWMAVYVLVDLECLNRLRPHPTSIFTTLFCALSAACCGTLTQIFLKVVSMVVRTYFEEDIFDVDRELVPFLIAAGLMVCTAATQMYLINATMASGKVIIAVPSYSSLTIVLTITGSAIFYGDFESLDRHNIINFAIGVSIVGVGIILLSVLQWCRYHRKGKGALRQNKPMEADQLLAKRRKTDLRDLGTNSSTGSPPSLTSGSLYDGTSLYGESEMDASTSYGGSKPATHYAGSTKG